MKSTVTTTNLHHGTNLANKNAYTEAQNHRQKAIGKDAAAKMTGPTSTFSLNQTSNPGKSMDRIVEIWMSEGFNPSLKVPNYTELVHITLQSFEAIRNCAILKTFKMSRKSLQ
jgi:hypothetical protein